MRRFALVLLALALTAAVGIPAAAADTSAPSTPAPSTPPPSTPAFCRSTDRLLLLIARTPDPRQLDTVPGRRALRRLHADAPPNVEAATKTVVSSFGYLMRHGARTLSKDRDAKTGDAMFRIAIYGATRCKQRSIRVLAERLLQRRLAQADAAHRQPAGTSTTTAP